MKKLTFITLFLLSIASTFFVVSCREPEPEPEPEPEVNPLDNHYFDIWVRVGSGGSQADVVRNVADVAQPATISFENQGTDVTEYMDEESIIHGKYYYQIPVSGDRYSKLQITDKDGLVKVAERPFGTNTYKTYRYTAAWISDKEFVIMACNGDRSDVIWTKLRDEGNALTIVSEGALNLPKWSPEVNKYNTAGIARYRKADNKIQYVYCEYGGNDEAPRVYVATINALSMQVEDVDYSTAGAEMAGTAYGELLQDKVFVDDDGTLYVPVVATLPDGKRVAVTGDEPLNMVNEHLIAGADWLLSEAFCLYAHREQFRPYEKYHSTALDAGLTARVLGVKNLLLYHTEDHHLDTRRRAYAAEAGSQFKGNIVVPDDLEVITL